MIVLMLAGHMQPALWRDGDTPWQCGVNRGLAGWQRSSATVVMTAAAVSQAASQIFGTQDHQGHPLASPALRQRIEDRHICYKL